MVNDRLSGRQFTAATSVAPGSRSSSVIVR